MRIRRSIGAVLAAAVLVVGTGCASSEDRARGSEDVIRLGVFPNLTHAPAYVALETGIFDDVLAPARVEVTYFNSGSDAGTALLGGSIDATYIGPGPSTSLFLQSGDVAVVSGVTAGGASFVVRTGAGISTPADLSGKRLAVPGVGNTQDVALRTWLRSQGLEANDAGGDVNVAAVDNKTLVQLFQQEQLDGAWEPEPWPTILESEGLATTFVDEASLWPDGLFATTNLLVNTTYADAHPDLVRRLVEANVRAIEFIREDPVAAKAAAQAGLVKAGAPSLDQAVVDAAWEKLTFTWNPVPTSLATGAQNAFDLGFLDTEPAGILAIYRLGDLNAVLEELGEDPVEVPTA